MSQTIPSDLVPLSEDEKDFLLFIFKKRKRFLVVVYAILFLAVFLFCLFSFGMDTVRSLWVAKEVTKSDSTLGLRLINLVALFVILILSGVYFYVKRVLTYKRDAESGEKERLAYTIVRKEHFPMTNQYYVTFNDPNYLHHQTDEETWYNCYEGGYFFIYRAKRSKFVFEDNRKFTII